MFSIGLSAAGWRFQVFVRILWIYDNNSTKKAIRERERM